MQFLSLLLTAVITAFAAILYGSYKETKLESFQQHGAKLKSNPEEANAEQHRIYTSEELAKYKESPLYLAILGSVYDVSRGASHYGPGSSYNFFVGRDASVSFVTGNFEHYDKSNADDVLQLQPADLDVLFNWKKLYDKDYIYKGRLIGRFYDQEGQPTAYHLKMLEIIEQEKITKELKEQTRKKYPDCNIQWSKEIGTRVWCSTDSGGYLRDWAGHPRKFYEIGSETYRCACIPKNQLSEVATFAKRYTNCTRFAHECFYKIE